MKDDFIDIIIMIGGALALIVLICLFIFCSYIGNIKAITSSPVEEMYHRQLIVTLDSILDARFSVGYHEEVVDTDNNTIRIDSVGHVIMTKK